MNTQEIKQNTVIEKDKTEAQTIQHYLYSKKMQIEKALPRHMTADKLLRIVATELSRNNKLKLCSAQSLVTAVIQSSQLGLFPDSLAGEAYLIPYENRNKNVIECQFQIGYKGLIKLAYNSAKVDLIEAFAVHENDEFDFYYGTNQYLKFRPNLKNRGEIYCYYAQARLTSGATPFVVCSIEDIENHKKYSKTAGSSHSPWGTHYDEMAKKTAIRILLKFLPKSADDLNLMKGITLDEYADCGIQDNSSIIDGDTGEVIKQSKTEKLKSELGATE